jgi:hypothetical protein
VQRSWWASGNARTTQVAPVACALIIAAALQGCDKGKEPFQSATVVDQAGDKLAAAVAYDHVCNVAPRSKFCGLAQTRAIQLRSEIAEQDRRRQEQAAEQEKKRQEEEARRREMQAQVRQQLAGARTEFEDYIQQGTKSGLRLGSIALKEVDAAEDAVVLTYSWSAFNANMYRRDGGRIRNVILDAIFREKTQAALKKHTAWPALRVKVAVDFAEQDRFGNVTGSSVKTIGEVTVPGEAVRNVNLDKATQKLIIDGADQMYDWLAGFAISVKED